MLVTIKQYSRFFINLLSLLLVLPMFLWAALGLASDLLAAAPETAMQRWSCSGKIDDLSSWETYRVSLTRSLMLDPGNATKTRMLAKMYEWRTFDSAPWDEKLQNEKETSRSLYRQVTRQRPSWAMGWAELANFKIRNMELDNEAFFALERALVLAPWQKDVQNKVIWLAVGIWDSVPENIKKLTKHNLRMLLNKEITIDKAILMAFRFRWMNELESILSSDDERALFSQYRDDEKRMQNIWKRMAKLKPQYCSKIT